MSKELFGFFLSKETRCDFACDVQQSQRNWLPSIYHNHFNEKRQNLPGNVRNTVLAKERLIHMMISRRKILQKKKDGRR